MMIALTIVLVSCDFNTERKSEIKHRIQELEQRIEKRSKQETLDKAFIQSAMNKYQDKQSETGSDKMLKFHTIIEPATKRLDELKTQDLADQAEIDKLEQEYQRY